MKRRWLGGVVLLIIIAAYWTKAGPASRPGAALVPNPKASSITPRLATPVGTPVASGSKPVPEHSPQRPERETLERWNVSLHRVGYSGTALTAREILDRDDPKDIPESLKEQMRESGSLAWQVVQDPGTITVPFNKNDTDCAVLNQYQLKSSALIAVDANGAVVSAAPRAADVTLPDSIRSCVFRPFVDASGSPIGVTVSYSPFLTQAPPSAPSLKLLDR